MANGSYPLAVCALATWGLLTPCMASQLILENGRKRRLMMLGPDDALRCDDPALTGA